MIAAHASGARLRPPARLRTDPMLFAFAASIAVHAGLVVFSVNGGRGGGIPAMPAVALRALLTSEQPAARSIIASVEPAPIAIRAAPELETPIIPATANAESAPSSRAATGARELGVRRVAAVPLTDRTRVGDLWSRQVTDFPIELDRPPRLDERIEAKYPPTALAAGREDTVVAWIVVDETGAAAEIEIAEGTEEFAEAVRAAVQTAHFTPARNNRKPIRFPIALEFRFKTGAPAATAAKAGER
jgi:TonB family protein